MTFETEIDGDLDDLNTQDKFLGAWAEWRETGLLDELQVHRMRDLLDTVHMAPVYRKEQFLHGRMKQEDCFCDWCKQAIMFWLMQCTCSSYSFYEAYLDDLHYVWVVLGDIFTKIVDFKTFCVQCQKAGNKNNRLQ